MPVSFCDVTSSIAPVATAASIALPPWRRMLEAGLAPRADRSSPPCRGARSTSERPCDSQPCARDPGTALIAAPGCGTSTDGTPKAFGDCATGVASIATKPATVMMMTWRNDVRMREILRPKAVLSRTGPLPHRVDLI